MNWRVFTSRLSSVTTRSTNETTEPTSEIWDNAKRAGVRRTTPFRDWCTASRRRTC
jgi:hypothetical protein